MWIGGKLMRFRASLSWASILMVVLALLTIQIYRWGGALTVLSGVMTREFLPLLLLAAALGTDAMSLSIGIGLRGVRWQDVVRVSLVIGFFHIVMPLVGTVGGVYFGALAGGIAKWVGAVIVAYIGGRMIWGCLGRKSCPPPTWTLSGIPLLLLALGVSIDALSVGFSLGTFGYNIFVTALIFGIFGAVMTAIGLMFGHRLGKIVGDGGELIGGAVLIVLAIQMCFWG